MRKRNAFHKLIIGITLIIAIASISVLIMRRNEIVKEQAEVNKMLATNTSTWDTSKINTYTDSNGAIVPIPVGYTVSGVSGEKVVKTGLVIYEGTGSVTSAPTSGSSLLSSAQVTRNQWVWIPVSNISRIYEETNGVKKSKLYTYSSTTRTAYTNNNYEPASLISVDTQFYFFRYNLQTLNKYKLYEEIQKEFEETIKSIEKYGGFYVGRYETGNVSQKTPVVRKLNEDIGGKSWYEMYSKTHYLGTKGNVKANMIYGALWDEILQWLVDSGSKTYSQIGENSSNWGNFSDATFTYINTSGNSATKSKGGQTKLPTGSSEYAKANNIYDMAGNVWEWTLEADGANSRRYRGGNFWDSGSTFNSSYRGAIEPLGSTYYFGYRAYMYIK